MQNKEKYKFSFQNIGGATRVKLQSGEDLRHLAELDEKMWTVLSCPTSGLYIDENTLSYVDTDNDGKIHVKDIIATAQWLTSVVKNTDEILEGKSAIALDNINVETVEGLKLYKSASEILKQLGKQTREITFADAVGNSTLFSNMRFNGDGVITTMSIESEEQKAVIEAIVATIGGCRGRGGEIGVNAEQIEMFYGALNDFCAWQNAKPLTPYGEKIEQVIALYKALDDKVRDFFLRSQLVAFDNNSVTVLDVQPARFEAISSENLTTKVDEIASYPIARINTEAILYINETSINPVWKDRFMALSSVVFSGKNALSLSDWLAFGESLLPYITWQEAKAGDLVESLGIEVIKQFKEQNLKDQLLALVKIDEAMEVELCEMDSVSKLLHLYRDFFTLLKNFVTFQDFYTNDKATKAIFQAGTLFIDQRACHLCVRITDIAKQNTMAAASGMYLIFCECTCKQKTEKLQIIAAMTQGDTGNLMVGKNAIFYDRDGLDWDAVVTKIIENPISISQAFWSPYRRISVWIENLINKRAAEKDSKMMADATEKLSLTPDLKPTGTKTDVPAMPFDIAKFAGIFAAIGMALGMIGTTLVSVAKGFSELALWQGVLVVIGLICVISGPSMIMAALKLRRRNLAPILNANGWAINASSIVNITFGSTLTEKARFPKIKMKDPFTKKGLATWKKWFIVIVCLAAIVGGISYYFCNKSSSKPQPAAIEQVIEVPSSAEIVE